MAVTADRAELADLASLALQLAPQPELAATLASQLPEDSTGLAALAATVTSQATDHHRQLAAARPDAFTPDLARSLDTLAVALGRLGQGEEALVASEEAVAIYRQLAAARPDTFTPDQARSLDNLAAALAGLGRGEEALAAAEEAVSLHRQSAAAQTDAFTGVRPSSESSMWPWAPVEAIESALRAEPPSYRERRIREAVKSSDIYALGLPAGDTSAPGCGTETDLLHFTIDDAGAEVVMLPVFTNPTAMRAALIRNPEWQTYSVLQINGGTLLDNVDNHVTILINPWTDLEYQLLPRQGGAG